jgi:GT2 family glycosyltransferase
MSDSVCAVVVTYNRKELLFECLEALRKQTGPIQGICLIDNASTDGTPELLLEKGYIKESPPQDLKELWEKEFIIQNLTDTGNIRLHYVRMHENTGGAGGFYEGVKRGYKKGYGWLWLMDDDTVPTETALENLTAKVKALDINKIGFLGSKVLWTDKTPSIMNLPAVKPFVNGMPFNFYEEKDVLLVELASFVSLLIRKEAIEDAGLPIKEFFIWADDVEYTLRITKKGFLGLYVKDSIVTHKTRTNYSPAQVYDWRFYYNVRNWLWVYRLHYQKKYFIHLLRTILLTFRLPFQVWPTNIKAAIDSFVKKPKIEYCK